MIKIIFLIYVYITLKIILDKDPFEYVIEFYEKNNSGGQIIEPNDMYYCVTIDRTNFSYTVNKDCNCVFTGGTAKLK